MRSFQFQIYPPFLLTCTSLKLYYVRITKFSELQYRAVIFSCLTHTHLHPQTDPGHLETFQSLLRDNPCVFHACRTATSLHHHWVLMGHYNLLNNQKGSVLVWKALIRVNGGGALLWYPFRFSQDNPVNEEIAAGLRSFLEPMADYSLQRPLLVGLEPCSMP